MKGIIILRFTENYEVTIIAQYPNTVSKEFKIKPSDLMNIYTLHRMNKKVANFFQMEIKEFTVGSLYTGSSSERYIGRPDYAITILFSNEEFNKEGLPHDFEGSLRRIAHELLIKLEDPNFQTLLMEYFLKLENGELEPFWEELKDFDENKLEKPFIEPHLQKAPELKSASEDIDPKNEEYYKLENDVLKGEIDSLELIIKEKNEKIKDLTNQLTFLTSEKSEVEDWNAKVGELEEINKNLKEEIQKLHKQGSKQSERTDKQEEDILELKSKIITKDTLIDELKRKVETLTKKVEELKKIDEESIENLMKIDTSKEEIKSLKQQIEKATRENEIHLDNVAKFKLEIRELKEQITSHHEQDHSLNDTIIDLKKEIKVLRRERDHYKEIIKEKKLLE